MICQKSLRFDDKQSKLHYMEEEHLAKVKETKEASKIYKEVVKVWSDRTRETRHPQSRGKRSSSVSARRSCWRDRRSSTSSSSTLIQGLLCLISKQRSMSLFSASVPAVCQSLIGQDPWRYCALIGWIMMLLRQLSYAIKIQLKEPYKGHFLPFAVSL